MRPTWDEYFLEICEVVKNRSHDIHTKHGCVLTLNNRIIGTGYNAWPEGIDWGEEFLQRPLKYEDGVILHAEQNALFNRTTVERGFTAYVTGQPCMNCLVSLGQSGVARIVYPAGYASQIIESENDKTREIYLEQKNIIIHER
jgi:dCMP deaminase